VSLPVPLWHCRANSVRLGGVATTRARDGTGCGRGDRLRLLDSDYRELLARPDIDVVDVSVPNTCTHEDGDSGGAAGKHIYCEKPLAMNVAEAQRMVAPRPRPASPRR
jgi:predicted dehydrogenase